MEREQARAVYDASVVVDGLGPIFWYQRDFETFLNQVVEAGITAFNHTMVTPYDHRPASLEDLMQEIALWEKRSEQYADKMTIARTVDDILDAKKTGRVAVIFGLQNASPIGTNPDLVRILHRVGVRIIGLTYQYSNLVAGGNAEPTDGGLTSLGREVVAAMNELGILICLSHVGIDSSLEVMELSQVPVVISHGNVRKLSDHPRNLTDEQIDALAATDGTIGVGAWCSLVSTDPQNVTLDQFLNHVDYLVDRIGVEHVGTGIDLAEGLPVTARAMSTEPKLRVLIGTLELGKFPDEHRYPPELDSVTKRPALGGYLARRGYGEAEIQSILGGSFLRVFRQVWRS